jgi:hypothetical protein
MLMTLSDFDQMPGWARFQARRPRDKLGGDAPKVSVVGPLIEGPNFRASMAFDGCSCTVTDIL